jgi:hypothetical protein
VDDVAYFDACALVGSASRIDEDDVYQVVIIHFNL